MPWVAAIGAVASAAAGANAAEDASSTAADAAAQAGQAQLTGMREALAQQQNMFDFGLGANAPQMSMGYGAMGAMSQMLGMNLPETDQTDYEGQIAGYKKQLSRLSKKRKAISKSYNAQAGEWGKDHNTGTTREETERLRSQQHALQDKIKNAERSQRTQTMQRNALSQFETGGGEGGEGGSGTTLGQIQPFNFQFDASQLGETDSYKFRQEQSLEALDRRLAAGGMRGSGNRYSGILELASNMASTEYEAEYGRQYGQARDAYSSQFDVYNLYASMAGMGRVDLQTAAGAGANMGNTMQQGYAGMGDAMMEGGAAGAAGIMGQNNAFQGGMRDLFNIGGQAGWFDSED